MAKVTITIEGDHTEIRQALRRMLGRRAGSRMDRPGRCGERERAEGGWRRRKMGMRAAMEGWTPWTQAELAQLWGEISAGAQAVLSEIARRPEGYPNAELQQVLGLPGNAIGGSLSSVGVASKRFGPRPPLYFFRWDAYRMAPPVAQAILALAKQEPKPPGA